MKTGQGLLELEFFHALYAVGVQDFNIRIKVLQRAENFMAGRIIDTENGERLAVISHIGFEWLEKFCPELMRTFPPDSPCNRWGDCVSAYLDSIFFQKPEPPCQPDNLDDGSENDWLTNCALRFDGYACAATLGLEEQPGIFCPELLSGRLSLRTTDELMTGMHMLQRYLMKEGVRSKTDRGWKLFRELFLELAPLPVPIAYQGFRHERWEKDFAPVLPAGLALIRHLHESANYDADCPV
jgi:hypothetical protein